MKRYHDGIGWRVDFKTLVGRQAGKGLGEVDGGRMDGSRHRGGGMWRRGSGGLIPALRQVLREHIAKGGQSP